MRIESLVTVLALVQIRGKFKVSRLTRDKLSLLGRITVTLNIAPREPANVFFILYLLEISRCRMHSRADAADWGSRALSVV